MNLLEPIIIGMNQIRVHKLRAMLSILGILISVGSVTGIVSMGEGLQSTVTEQFEQMGGPSFIWVRSPGNYYREGRRWVRRDWEDYLTNNDLRRIQEEIPNIKFIVPIIYLDLDVRYRNASTSARIRASNEYYDMTQNWKMGQGRFINKRDIQNASKVVVIGPQLAEDIYGKENPVGKELKVSGGRFLVIGVLAEMRFFGNTNERILVGPYTTAQKRFIGNDRLNQLHIIADSPENVEDVAQQIRNIMKRFHEHGEEFEVRTGEEQIGQFNRVVTIMKIVAGGIAGISLIVGGIGIMNIMLVSVSERTREIGIRKALGAKKRNILFQFLLEAIVLCLFGGGLGLILGTGIGTGISTYIKSLTDLPFESVMTPELMIFAVAYSAGIGLFFGVYPAYRAARLDPVEALRYE